MSAPLGELSTLSSPPARSSRPRDNSIAPVPQLRGSRALGTH